MKQLDLVLCGFGQIGRMLYKPLLTRTDFRLVAVIDSSPEFIGRDAGTAAGCAPCGIPVTGSPAGLAVRADVAVVTTVSDADAAADTIAGLLGKGMPVVTTCEELFYPYPLHLDAAAKISAAAQAAQLPRTEMVVLEQLVLRDAAFFHRLPKRVVSNHKLSYHPWQN
mgnify:CR=1 FL=1